MVRLLQAETGFEVIDLKSLDIGHYDYDHSNRGDDFLPLMRRIVREFDLVIFATPIYWYSMSGIMKAFLDRITDCLKIEKETGRQLRGMSMGLLICGSEPEETPGFEYPFRESAGYLGMEYIGGVHTWQEGTEVPEEAAEKIKAFAARLYSASPD